MDAKDSLLTAKITQAFYANRDHGEEDIYKVGDKVMLSMLHQRQEWKAGDKNRIAKFFPRFDGHDTSLP